MLGGAFFSVSLAARPRCLRYAGDPFQNWTIRDDPSVGICAGWIQDDRWSPNRVAWEAGARDYGSDSSLSYPLAHLVFTVFAYQFPSNLLDFLPDTSAEIIYKDNK